MNVVPMNRQVTRYEAGFLDGLEQARRLMLGEAPAGGVLEAGPVRVDRERRTVSVHGRPVMIGGRRYLILEALLSGRLVKYDYLVSLLYPDGEEPQDPVNVIRVMMHSLRAVLDAAGAVGLIRNVWGVGYRLNLPTAAAVAAVREAA
jgi:DNA-binding response OmpR family regulator